MATRTNLLPANTTDASSTDQSVDSGAQVTLGLIGADGTANSVPLDAVVLVELKGSDGTYRPATELELSGMYERRRQIQGPLAAFRVHRVRGDVGVDLVV